MPISAAGVGKSPLNPFESAWVSCGSAASHRGLLESVVFWYQCRSLFGFGAHEAVVPRRLKVYHATAEAVVGHRRDRPTGQKGGVLCQATRHSWISPPFQVMSKRRRSFPSESRVKRGHRFVHGDKELIEKLGRNDSCPCGSGRKFQEVLHAGEALRRRQPGLLLLESDALA